MNRELNPTYSFEEMMLLIERLDTVKEFDRLSSIVSSDTDNYTATEYLKIKKKFLQFEKPIWNKEFDAKVKIIKEHTIRNNKNKGD